MAYVPYKDPEKQRKYQRDWIAKRRQSWLEGRSCVVCGSVDGLEIDHIDPDYKWKHNFWSYSWEKINAELAKCQVLCWVHHNEKTAREVGMPTAYSHGTKSMWAEHGCRCAVCDYWYQTVGKERTRLAMVRFRERQSMSP